jgi:hypothetical protein
MILRDGSCPKTKAGKATEVMIHFNERGDMLTISRRTSPPAHAFKLPGDRFDMPTAHVVLTRTKGCEDLVHEGSELASQQRF